MFEILEKHIGAQYMKPVKKFCARLDQRVPPKVKVYFDKFGISPSVVLAAVPIYLFISMLFGLAGQFICALIGFVYPAYRSFKAIETPESHDDRQWLTYWVVYAAFSCLEIILEPIIGLFTSYYLLKLLLISWLMLPQFNGATFLYDTVVSRFLKSQEEKIDKVIDDVTKKAENLIGRKSVSETK
eukprot:GDKJ01056330.1.p1 GENE.GDKJ01056330.1~~GDKJ01056330.1.p1  ORF type:complete len:185 (+),score=13.70 GDKJ01056330.1:42-596(+)